MPVFTFKVSMKSFSVNSLVFSSCVLVSISLNMYLFSFSDWSRKLSKLLVKFFMLLCSFSIDSYYQIGQFNLIVKNWNDNEKMLTILSMRIFLVVKTIKFFC